MKTIKEILALNLPVFNDAYAIASEAHKDQKRKDGKPYMTHIDAVIEGTYKLLYEKYIPKYLDSDIEKPTLDHASHATVSSYLIVAALHDVFEDRPSYNIDAVVDGFAGAWPERYEYMVPEIRDALHRISKKEFGIATYEKYSEYVERVKRNKLSRRAKRADLIHNMSDLNPGNMYDKYELTLAVLTAETFDY